MPPACEFKISLLIMLIDWQLYHWAVYWRKKHKTFELKVIIEVRVVSLFPKNKTFGRKAANFKKALAFEQNQLFVVCKFQANS